MSLLLYASLALNGVMLLDAIRHRAPPLWFLVLLTPIGGLLYLLSVKLPDLNIRPAATSGQAQDDQDEQDAAEGEGAGRTRGRAVSAELDEPQITEAELEELRATVAATPSFANRVALGWTLAKAGHAKEAEGYFEAGLRSHPHDKEALLGLGLTAIADHRPEDALAPLDDIIDRSFAYRDYQAARLLVRALLETKRVDEAISLCEHVVHHSRRYSHQLELAQLLAKTGQKNRAHDVATQLLSEWELEGELQRQRHAPTATLARELLRRLAAET